MKDPRRGSIEHSIHALVANQAPSGAFLATPVMPDYHYCPRCSTTSQSACRRPGSSRQSGWLGRTPGPAARGRWTSSSTVTG